MPSENKTPNIGLNMWQGNEYAKRQDFVEDNIVIDEEIKGLKNSIENIEVPVTSVNDETGAVVLTASDVGASPIGHGHAYSEISGKPSTFPPSGHEHTPSQVGLSNVFNYGIATTAEAQAGAVNTKYMTPSLVKSAVQHLATTGGISMVKSIQRGAHAGGSQDINIPLASINPNKSFVIVNSSINSIGNTTLNSPSIKSLISSQLTLSPCAYGSTVVPFSWQVVEYN